MTLVYLDTETTGLDPDLADVWEIAYAVDDGPILSSFVAHSTVGASPDALALNGYLTRFKGEPLLGLSFEADLREVLNGATVVGSNPAFDTAFLARRWGARPWKHRLLDLGAYAMPHFGLDEPKGLAWIAGQWDIEQPDHTAAMDVHVLRECHRTLRSVYGKGRSDG